MAVLNGRAAAAWGIPIEGRIIKGALRVAATGPRNLAGRHRGMARVVRKAHLDTGVGAGSGIVLDYRREALPSQNSLRCESPQKDPGIEVELGVGLKIWGRGRKAAISTSMAGAEFPGPCN